MAWYHTKCGGDISILRRRCRKCKKKWSLWSILFDPHIHPGTSYKKQAEKPKRKPTSYAKWADNYPGVAAVAGRLPNFPKPVRITIAFVLFGGIFFGLFLLLNWKIIIPIAVVLVVLTWRAYRRHRVK